MRRIILPQPPNTRIPTSEDDWGDDLTRGLHLIRRGMSFDDRKFNRDFGIYLGNNRVGLKDIDYTITSIIEYENPELMHKEWILD